MGELIDASNFFNPENQMRVRVDVQRFGPEKVIEAYINELKIHPRVAKGIVRFITRKIANGRL